jgi:microcystin-dependent protein
MTDCFVGEIRIFSSANSKNIPSGWLPCEGQLLQIREYTALYSLLGTYYGGDKVNTFGLPDFRGRVALGYGPGYPTPGAKGGADRVVLAAANFFPHNHTVMATASTLTGVAGPAFNYIGEGQKNAQGVQPFNLYAPIAPTPPNVALNAATFSTAGGGEAHENRQPLIALRVCIATLGTYPPRQ